MSDLCDVAYAHWNAEAREDYLLQRFVEALRDPELARHIRLDRPQSLAMALEKAIHVESVLAHDRRENRPQQQRQVQVEDAEPDAPAAPKGRKKGRKWSASDPGVTQSPQPPPQTPAHSSQTLQHAPLVQPTYSAPTYPPPPQATTQDSRFNNGQRHQEAVPGGYQAQQPKKTKNSGGRA